MERHFAKPVLTLAALGLAAGLVSGCKLAVVKPLTADGEPVVATQQTFSAVEFVDSLWDSKVLPTVEQGAVDLTEVSAALESDPEGARAKYGHQEGTGPYNFLIKAQGTVTAVDTTSRVGLIQLDLAPGDGQPDATVQIGPVLRGTAIRDGVGFITFDLFTNQLEYADVANQLNDRVLQTALKNLNPEQLTGKSVTLLGVLALEADGPVVTPVTFEVGG